MFDRVNAPRVEQPRRRGLSIVPFLGDLLVMTRVVRDREAHTGLKLLALLSILYVVLPVDALPEAVMPLVGYLDDVGLMVGLRLLLERPLAKYRYPLFEKPALARRDAQFASG